MMDPLCALCANDLPKMPISDGSQSFCCHGCHAVFTILAGQNQLANYQETPLFKQAVRSGLISNPLLLQQIRDKQIPLDGELQKLHLEVGEMWCPSCAEVIKLILLQEPGVRNCIVDYATDLASVEFSPRYLSQEKIFGIISSLGYQPKDLQNAENKAVSRMLYFRFAIAAFCSLNIMMFSYPLYATYFDFDADGYGLLFAWLSFFFSLPVLFFSAWPILRRFLTSLKAGIYGMETLVVIGVFTSFLLSCADLAQGGTRVYFDSMSVIIVFVLLGKIIESKAKFSAKESLFRLSRAVPRRGRKRMLDGTSAFVPVKEIQVGDSLIAYTGEKIVLDGVICEGEGACDESLMTGEAVPIAKKSGDLVMSGSIVQTGSFIYRVLNSVEASTLQKIIEMVEKDIGYKTAYVRSADQIVKWFVPVVIGIATLSGLLSLLQGNNAYESLLRAISVLLISCPCAIGIAAPLAESHLLNKLAGLGAIVRNRGCLALLGKETLFVFDKTGTITEGNFTVIEGLSNTFDLNILKGLAEHSTHPIASAISRAVNCSAAELTFVEEIAGKGIRGSKDEDTFYLGSEEFLRNYGIKVPEVDYSRYSEIVTVVYFACLSKFVTPLILGDKIRVGACEMIQGLKPIRTVLLSGDGESSVERTAQVCGFDEWKANCTPLIKRHWIDTWRTQGQVVCMFGDGINDAPALTGAQIGISVVTATDISIQVSDLLLTTDRLEVVGKIRQLAKFGRKIVHQNLFWAFFYNVVGIGFAFFGLLSPIFAAVAMVLSSLMVLFNAKRI